MRTLMTAEKARQSESPGDTTMFMLETPRLLIIETPLSIMERRLHIESFEDDLPIPDGAMRVTFPAEWPGDGIGMFRRMVAELRQDPDSALPGGTIIDKSSRTAVGQLSFKGPPDQSGSVEVGYGVNRTCEGRGYMTEAVEALVRWGLAQPDIERVTAECLDSNFGSIRVLEKSGFARVGERFDEEEGGRLILWECRE